LELSPLALHQQIAEFGDRALELGCDRLQIVPLFLLPGVHVMEDIPAEVALAQQSLGLKLEVRPYLGSHPGLIRLLASQLDRLKAWILLAHGSSRAGAEQPTEAIARQLETLSAYWAVAPSLESRVQELVSRGNVQIGILPYFLFAGGITDAIAQKVKQLQEQFPSIDFHLAQPLGASQELTDLILDLVER
jgi:sirohydrochlorin ferrochelatase